MASTVTTEFLQIGLTKQSLVQMPAMKEGGLTITKEKVWSKNTGRGASGLLIGDIVTIKYKLQCEWPKLTREEATKIDRAITPKFVYVRFLDPYTNSLQTKHMYAGTPSYPVYTYKAGVKTYNGVKVDLIEV